MSQNAAFEVRANLALNEGGDGGARPFRSCEELEQIRSDDLVEESFLRLVASVVGDGRASAGIRTGLGDEFSRGSRFARVSSPRRLQTSRSYCRAGYFWASARDSMNCLR